MDRLKENLRRRGVLGRDWRWDSEDEYMRFGCKKGHVKDLIELMDDEDDQEWMEGLWDREIFPFTYNGIGDANPNPGYDPDEFRNGRSVAVKFTTHAINFRSGKNPTGTYNYNFRLQSLYLVDSGKKVVSTPSWKKRGPDDWLVSPPRTRKTTVHVNPLEWSVGNSRQ